MQQMHDAEYVECDSQYSFNVNMNKHIQSKYRHNSNLDSMDVLYVRAVQNVNFL